MGHLPAGNRRVARTQHHPTARKEPRMITARRLTQSALLAAYIAVGIALVLRDLAREAAGRVAVVAVIARRRQAVTA
jgi:hypothetical protein